MVNRKFLNAANPFCREQVSLDMTQETVTEVRKGRKFEQVVAGALRVFLRDGYEGASVDEIAREAGVSKATLYSYFPDKRVMFLEVFSAEFSRLAVEAASDLSDELSAEAFLLTAGRRVIDLTVSDFGRNLFRLVVAEVPRFPELAQQFYEHGSGQLRRRLVSRLEKLCERGELRIEDCELAADQFIQLCRAGVHEPLLLDISRDIPQAEICRAVAGAVEMFLARYAVVKP